MLGTAAQQCTGCCCVRATPIHMRFKENIRATPTVFEAILSASGSSTAEMSSMAKCFFASLKKICTAGAVSGAMKHFIAMQVSV